MFTFNQCNLRSFWLRAGKLFRAEQGILQTSTAATKTMPAETTFDEVKQELASKSTTYVDVRNRNELVEDGKIAGSVNIPLPEFKEGFSLPPAEFEAKYGFSKPDVDACLITGCRSGKRALAAAEALEASGYKNVKIYPGSFLEWAAKGGALESK